ncbi:MAG: BPTI/Kunitz domain-containing protein [Polyangiaceae bacterium]
MTAARLALAWLWLNLGLAAAGCGGATSKDPDAGSGGAPMSTGGRSSSGGATSAGGAAASGGSTSPDRCSLPADSGLCAAAFMAFYYDASLGDCREFIWGGCGGNENRFNSLAECQAACGGGSETGCQRASDCELRSTGCCGGCEPVSIDDLQAVNVNAPRVTCGVLCGACPPYEPNTSTSRYFVAGCVEHRCTVIDIRQTPITECASDADCALRAGANCCTSCGGEPIAYNVHLNELSTFCPDGPTPCPSCVGSVGGYTASCLAGRCEVDVAAAP